MQGLNREANFKGGLCALLQNLTIICLLSFKRLMFRDYHLENPVGTFATRSLQLSTFRHSISDQGMTDRAVFMGRAGKHDSVFPHQSHQEMPRVHRNLDDSGSYFQLSLLLADGRVQFPPLPASARPMLRGRYLPVY